MKREITLFQAEMATRQVSMCLIPTGDFHLSEYAGAFFGIRKFLSGFTGSAGTLLVTEEEALLWTDGRYFVQAEQELVGTGIKLMKSGEADVPEVEEYLRAHLKKGQTLAFDGRLISARQGLELEEIAADCGAALSDDQWIDTVWKDRPDFTSSQVSRLGLFYTGRRVQEKLELLRSAMEDAGADTHVTGSLDEIAWLFNLRGSDIPCNPVFFSYAVITQEEAVLFLRDHAADEELAEVLADEGVRLLSYDTFYDYLEEELRQKKVMLDAAQVNYAIWNIAQRHNDIIRAANPCIYFKAIKNTAEIENMRQAQEADGLCMCRFLYWIKEQMRNETPLTESDAAAYLDNLRLGQRDCTDLSFPTIAAYGPNAAMCHYSPDKARPVALRAEGFLLVDSGGQYVKGTTDVTRTIALGELTHTQKEHYTLVLQGHIRLAMARFPKGVCGANLDVLARGPLWARGLDYNHGTGHGVGYYLNVHEGPNNISWNLQRKGAKTVPIEAGMLTSNEPGLYLEGEYGIRLENLILAKPVEEKGIGGYLEFETMTWVPFEREAILPKLLEAKELAWLNQYHRQIFERYASRMTKEERTWLESVTKPL